MELKSWYKSRTIWTGVVTAVLGTLQALSLIPESFDGSMIDELITAGMGILTVYFRAVAEKRVTLVAPE